MRGLQCLNPCLASQISLCIVTVIYYCHANSRCRQPLYTGNHCFVFRGYEYRDSNAYSALPQRNDNNSRYRSPPNDSNHYPADGPGSPADHYKSEDPYEWVAPRRQQGNQHAVNRNTGEFHNEQRANNRNSGEYRDGARNQNGRSFMNQIYMDTAELMRLRQEREQKGHYASPERSR